MRRFLRRLLTPFRHGQAETELAREIESHLALLEEQFRHDGLSADEARIAARRAFGGVEQVKERQRDARSFRWIDDARQDAAYGARSFMRNPGFTAAAALTLALGIGAATTIFGALYAIGLRALPYRDPDRIVRVFEYLPPREGTTAPRRGHPFSPIHLDSVRKASTLSHVALELPRLMVMDAGGTLARVGGSRVSAAMFELLGANPLRGRVLQDGDETPGNDNVVVIAHALWQQQFGGRDTVIGQSVTLDGRPHTIVGVMPPDFQFPPGSTGEVWQPVVPAGTAPTFRLPFYARLRDGVSIAAAQDEIATIYDSVRSTTPENRPRLEVIAAKDVLVEPIKPAMTAFAVAVVLVLLIACVNVANLVLARATVRRYEMALRAALGATRTRLLRQHLVEGTLLALIAGAGGLVIAAVCLSWLRAFGNAGPRRDMLSGLNIPRLAEIGVDPLVILFALAISLAAGLAFGVIAGVRQTPVLLSGLRKEIGGTWFGHRGLQHLLVVSEVSMAVMLCIGAALMLRSFLYLSAVDTGFSANGLLTFQASLPPSRSIAELTRFGEALVDRVGAMPGVRGAAYAESLPMIPVGRFAMLSTTPSFPKPGPPPTSLDVRIVSHAFIDVMNIRVVAGRSLREADDAGRPRVMVINEALQRSMFGGNAIGQRIYIGGTPTFDPPGRKAPMEPWEIVGVVADVRQRSVFDAPTPQIFVDQRQLPGPTGGAAINVVARVDGDMTALFASLRPMVAQLDPQALVENVAPMDRVVSSTFARPRLYALVFGIYAFVAIALAAMGIYGVIAFGVVQRTREIGIRMALGAGRRQVRALIARDSAIVAGAGLVIGIGGAYWSSRLFTGLLFGISPLDLGTYAAAAAAFAAVVALAAFVPARRASAVDPVAALRAE